MRIATHQNIDDPQYSLKYQYEMEQRYQHNTEQDFAWIEMLEQEANRIIEEALSTEYSEPELQRSAQETLQRITLSLERMGMMLKVKYNTRAYGESYYVFYDLYLEPPEQLHAV